MGRAAGSCSASFALRRALLVPPWRLPLAGASRAPIGSDRSALPPPCLPLAHVGQSTPDATSHGRSPRERQEVLMSKRLPPLVVLLALLLLGSWAGVALAQEEVQTTSKAAPAAARPPAIPLGQAQQTTAGQAIVRPPLSNEEKALLAVQEEGQQQVLALMRTLEGLSAGPERLAMEKKIAQVKQDYWIKMLRTKVDFARAR